jgi:hypothetical protein
MLLGRIVGPIAKPEGTSCDQFSCALPVDNVLIREAPEAERVSLPMRDFAIPPDDVVISSGESSHSVIMRGASGWEVIDGYGRGFVASFQTG